ncbi:MAG: EAL domain-containing protein [Prevotella sp.]|nr:EAL domain-containing protein [Alistipes senegalensis]MCM1358435.1 EAL domain-containing protein [Prevotella sp.]
MNLNSPLAAAIVMIAATALVIAYAQLFPDMAWTVIITYISTMIFLSIILAISAWLYRKHKSSIDAGEMAEIIENLDVEMIMWTEDFSAVYMNRHIRELLGIQGRNFDQQAEIMRAFGIDNASPATILEIINSSSHEAHFTGADEEPITIMWGTSIMKKTRKNTLFFSTGLNITELKKARFELASTNDLFNYSMGLAEIGLIMSNDMQNFIASPETVRMLDLKNNTLSLKTLRSLVHPNDRLVFDSAVKSTGFDNTNDVKSIEIRISSADGFYHWYTFRYKDMNRSDSLPIFSGALIDSSQEHEKDLIIERLAYIDEVTEIANRNKLMDVGQETYEQCQLLECSYWVIVLDIDRFHIVNDSSGYQNGNYILKNFANIIYKFVTPGGLAARISGDNFALILRDYGDDDLPLRTVKAIQEELAKSAAVNSASINLSCSAGYSKMPKDGDSFLNVFEHAEFALKSGGTENNTICGYEASMHDSIIGRNALERELALAIDNNELQLFYQPKIDLSTGKIMGVEALIRWIKPDGTIVRPDAFVPVAESSHLIGRISEFVLNEGCRQNKLWQKMGYPEIVMSINFTSTDFYQKDLKDKVFEALVKTGLDAKFLEVELTETLALSDIDYAVSQMNKLRELGVKLAMDDFGTGYSSLSYLQILPITLLKLDRSFIIDIEHDNIAYEIVSSVIRIAKSKKIETIAEGIENPNQEDILRKAGCDFGQGYYYGKPMPAEKLQEFFEENMQKIK